MERGQIGNSLFRAKINEREIAEKSAKKKRTPVRSTQEASRYLGVGNLNQGRTKSLGGVHIWKDL